MHTHTLMSHMYIVLHCAVNPAGLTSPRWCFIWGSRAGADGAMYWWLLSRGFGLCTHKRLCCRLGMGICPLQPWWLCFCGANGRISMHILMPQYPEVSLYLLWLFLGSRSSRDRDWQTQFGPGTLWQPHPLSAPVDSCQPCPPGQPGVKNHRVHLVIFPLIHQQKAELNKSCFGLNSEGVQLPITFRDMRKKELWSWCIIVYYVASWFLASLCFGILGLLCFAVGGMIPDMHFPSCGHRDGRIDILFGVSWRDP